MKKNLLFVPLVLMSMGLAACQDTDTETNAPTEDVTDETGSDTGSVTSEPEDGESIPTEGEATDPDYALLEQAKEEYYSGELETASETLSELLQNNLSEDPLLRSEAEELLEEITQQLSEDAAELNEESNEVSAYSEERQSSLLAAEFQEATEMSIEEATDEELGTWLTQMETEAAEILEESEWSREEIENLAFEQVIEWANLNVEDYFFFVNISEDDWVEVEVRETVGQDDESPSNLIGMYRYNISTEDVQRMEAITGEYGTIDK